MKYTDIKAMVITLDKDLFYKVEELATKWSWETKSADFLDFTCVIQDKFKEVVVKCLANYEIEKNYYRNNLKIEWLEEIPFTKLENQYILIRDKNLVKRM